MIRIFNDYESLSRGAAAVVVDLADQAIEARGRFSIALSGGHTPKRTYEILASEPLRKNVNWESVQVFWGDERCVPPDDPRNNARIAWETFLASVPIPKGQIHPVQSDLPPAKAAARYESELKSFFGEHPPVFDLILLGLGENAHTASLFPHTPVLNEKNSWAAEVYITALDMYRVTLTAPLINQAREVVFLVSGAEKAPALQNVLEGAYHPHDYPAQLIRPNGAHPTWLVDKAAAHKLVTLKIESA